MSKFRSMLSLVSLDERIVPSATATGGDIVIVGSSGSTAGTNTQVILTNPNTTIAYTASSVANMQDKGDLIDEIRNLDRAIKNNYEDITNTKVLIALVDVQITTTSNELTNAKDDLARLKLLKKPQAEIDAQQKKVDELSKKLIELQAERDVYMNQLCEASGNLFDNQRRKEVALDKLAEL